MLPASEDREEHPAAPAAHTPDRRIPDWEPVADSEGERCGVLGEEVKKISVILC